MDEIFKIIGEAILRSEAGSEICFESRSDSTSVVDIDSVLVELYRMSEENLEALHRKILLYICSNRMPRKDGKYYEFYDISVDSIAFNSKGVNWTECQEKRVARAVNGSRICYIRSKIKLPVYIIETENELELWKNIWRGRAFLTSTMVEQFFPTVL